MTTWTSAFVGVAEEYTWYIYLVSLEDGRFKHVGLAPAKCYCFHCANFIATIYNIGPTVKHMILPSHSNMFDEPRVFSRLRAKSAVGSY